MIPYLVSEDLRWSYGGFKGTREGTWGLDMRDDIQALADAGQGEGFCGVVVDRASFASSSDMQRYTSVLGSPDLVSEAGRWLFFEWPDDEVVPTVTPISGFSEAGPSPADLGWWQVEEKAVVDLSGMRPGTRSRYSNSDQRRAGLSTCSSMVGRNRSIEDVSGSRSLSTRTRQERLGWTSR